MKGEVFVGAAETSDEMVFERADGAFGGIATVEVWRGKLIVDGLCLEELLEGGGCFVVQLLKYGFEATGGEERVDALVCSEICLAGARLHGLGENHIAVVIVDDEQVRVAGAGRTEEAACCIGVDLAGDRLTSSVDGVCAEGGLGVVKRTELVGAVIGAGGGGGRIDVDAGGSLVGSVLIEVALDHGG